MAANPDGTSNLNDAAVASPVGEDSDAQQSVVAVAPLRVDLTGGFTDISPYSSSVDSLHINAAVDLSVTVLCRKRQDRQLRVGFKRDRSQPSNRTSDGRRRFLEAVRAGVAEFMQECGLDISIWSEAPAGSGLGSSGSILVAAIAGCAKLTGHSLTPAAVAKKAIAAAATACIVGGQQDEYAAAHGSLRAYRFDRGGTPQIQDLASTDACRYLEETLLVVQMSAGGRRSDVVADVVRAVRSGDQETLRALLRLQELAHELLQVMTGTRFEEFPQYLTRIRETQCALHPRMCCPIAMGAIEAARQEIPDLEYKILGGGGPGSCVLICVPASYRAVAASFLGEHAKKVWAIKIRPSGVHAEPAAVGEKWRSSLIGN